MYEAAAREAQIVFLELSAVCIFPATIEYLIYSADLLVDILPAHWSPGYVSRSGRSWRFVGPGPIMYLLEAVIDEELFGRSTRILRKVRTPTQWSAGNRVATVFYWLLIPQ